MNLEPGCGPRRLYNFQVQDIILLSAACFSTEIRRAGKRLAEASHLTKAQLRMQPCRFIRSDILVPLKALIDQFLSEGVLVSDISCTHASPLVVLKKEGGFRMAVDYQEVNQYLRVSPNQLPYKK